MDETKFPDKFWINLNIIYLIYQYNIKKQLYGIRITIRGKNQKCIMSIRSEVIMKLW